MRYYYIVMCLLSASMAIGQNIDRESVSVQFLRYPTEPLPEEIQTYSKEIYLGSLSNGGSRESIESSMRKAIDLPGFELVDNDAHLNIKLSIFSFSVTDIEYQSEEKSSKDKEGKVKKWKEYWYTFNYKYPAKLTVTNTLTEDEIFSGYINASQDYTSGSTGRTTDYDKLDDEYKKSLASTQRSARKAHIEKAQSIIRTKYGYSPTTYYSYLRRIKKYKKYEYPNLDQGYAKLKEALAGLEPVENYVTEDFKATVLECVELFKTELADADFDNKKARVNEKIASSLYNNIAICYYWINDFDAALEATENANTLKSNGWVSPMKADIKSKRERYEINGLL